MDINNFPVPALLNLLLQIEPREIKILCNSKNRKVRKICSSVLFKKAYSEKYDLLKGEIKFENNILKDEIGNEIQFKLIKKAVNNITYTPFRQIYPSTFIKNYSEDELRNHNPITISYLEGNLYIGRDRMSEVLTVEDEQNFINGYNKEVKEFLQYIRRESWWNPEIEFGNNQIYQKHGKEFKDEVIDLIKKNV